MTAPLVSIGLPVYNGEDYLAEALSSILNQTYTHFELIISDNGSTDSTRAICQAYAARDSRIRYFRSEQNRGATWNYNRVFELARGEYFKWHAHDDVCAPELLEKSVAVLERDPAAVLSYAKTQVIDENGNAKGEYPDRLHLAAPEPHQRYRQYHERYHSGGHCNPVFGVIRTHVLRATPLIGNYPSSDETLLGELALHGKFIEVPEYLFLRRLHERTSVDVHPSFTERMAWFDPAKADYLPSLGWRWFFFGEYVRAIQRAPLNPYQALRCYLIVGAWWRQRADDMLKDLVWIVKRNLLNLSAVAWCWNRLKTVKQALT